MEKYVALALNLASMSDVCTPGRYGESFHGPLVLQNVTDHSTLTDYRVYANSED